jgi:hypothetical protein
VEGRRELNDVWEDGFDPVSLAFYLQMDDRVCVDENNYAVTIMTMTQSSSLKTEKEYWIIQESGTE